jgi:hypothetical protein
MNDADEEAARDHVYGEVRFTEWLYMVNRLMMKALGVGVFDRDDASRWHPLFKAGMTPEAAVATLLKEHGEGSIEG